MSILRIGSSGKYADNWDAAFGKKAAKPAASASKAQTKKKSSKKSKTK